MKTVGELIDALQKLDADTPLSDSVFAEEVLSSTRIAESYRGEVTSEEETSDTVEIRVFSEPAAKVSVGLTGTESERCPGYNSVKAFVSYTTPCAPEDRDDAFQECVHFVWDKLVELLREAPRLVQ